MVDSTDDGLIREALERELRFVNDSDVSVPQLIGRAFPRLPAGSALPEVREVAEDLLGVSNEPETVTLDAIATDGGERGGAE